MLDFCPYEFISMDEYNLAYELVFPKGWNWERVKRETIIGEQKFIYLDENDQRRYTSIQGQANDETAGRGPIILLENKKSDRKNGLAMLQKFVSEAAEPGNAPGKSTERKMRLSCRIAEGVDAFVDENDRPVMYALPCCPHCHHRLPAGWQQAEDFGAVALMGPGGSGKTTFLLSMMNRNWEALQHFNLNGHRLRIAPAHRMDDKTDFSYFMLKKQSEEMCRAGGSCPESTEKTGWVLPVFLHIQYAGHTMILGLYDNAGEHLRRMDLLRHPNLRILLDKMFAQMFFFDPEEMNLSTSGRAVQDVWCAEKENGVLLLNEQGAYQQASRGKRVSGHALLAAASAPPKEGEILPAFREMYYQYMQTMQLNQHLDEMKRMLFLGIIGKSDRLEQMEEIRAREEYAPLFDREYLEDMLDIQAMEMRSELVEEMIEEFGLFGKLDIRSFAQDYGERAVSWHCISALGCGTDNAKEKGKLLGNYAPVRVAEPLMACIYRRMGANGWIKPDGTEQTVDEHFLDSLDARSDKLTRYTENHLALRSVRRRIVNRR